MVDRVNVAIRPMLPGDLPAGLRLSQTAGWNQTPADWRRMLHWEPGGCFVLELAGQVAGTVTTTRYGNELAWIGMMLVDTALRRRGFGRRLLQHAVTWLETRGVGAVMLDATPLGRPLYESLDFREVANLDRWQGVAAAHPGALTAVGPLDGQALSQLASLDRLAFGADRDRILQDLLAAPGARGFRVASDGYILLRPGALRWHIGPLVACDAATAGDLLTTALAALAGQPVEIDVPGTPGAQLLARQAGLESVRPFARMLRGGPAPAADASLIFASAAPEIG